VEKRLLFHRIACRAARHITEWHAQLAAVIEADSADAAPPRREKTAMPARHAPNASVFGPAKRSNDGAPIQRRGL